MITPWNQFKNVWRFPRDDAMLLVGIALHGWGNWEKIRTDPLVRLESKIQPSSSSVHVPATGTGNGSSATIVPSDPSGSVQLPNATQLNQRAEYLCKAIRDAAQAASQGKRGERAQAVGRTVGRRNKTKRPDDEFLVDDDFDDDEEGQQAEEDGEEEEEDDDADMTGATPSTTLNFGNMANPSSRMFVPSAISPGAGSAVGVMRGPGSMQRTQTWPQTQMPQYHQYQMQTYQQAPQQRYQHQAMLPPSAGSTSKQQQPQYQYQHQPQHQYGSFPNIQQLQPQQQPSLSYLNTQRNQGPPSHMIYQQQQQQQNQ